MYRFANEILQPLPLGFMAASLVWLAAWVRRKDQRRLLGWLFVPWLLVWISCTPAAAYLAVRTLERPYPATLERPQATKAIVILAAGGAYPGLGDERITLDDDTLERCWGGAELFRGGPPCLVLASGGKIPDNPQRESLAAAMKRYLIALGVDEEFIVCEERSVDTYENAVESAKLLRERGIDDAVLVTDATHLWRAVRCFERQGLGVTPVGVYYRGTLQWRVASFLPQASAVRTMQVVWHEYLGMAWYWVRGRV
jgi:uncharacterized SAM-binding protein YcdF (DUF218 family)